MCSRIIWSFVVFVSSFSAVRCQCTDILINPHYVPSIQGIYSKISIAPSLDNCGQRTDVYKLTTTYGYYIYYHDVGQRWYVGNSYLCNGSTRMEFARSEDRAYTMYPEHVDDWGELIDSSWFLDSEMDVDCSYNGFLPPPDLPPDYYDRSNNYDDDDDDDDLSGGAIAGIVIGCVVAAALITTLVVCLVKPGKQKPATGHPAVAMAASPAASAPASGYYTGQGAAPANVVFSPGYGNVVYAAEAEKGMAPVHAQYAPGPPSYLDSVTGGAAAPRNY